MNCRHCRAELTLPFIDLGTAPPSNAYLSRAQLATPERYYPLRVFACTACWLVQTEDFADRSELFSGDYAYFSSYSTSWLAHAEAFVDQAVSRFALDSTSLVVEVASNDGYLLQYVKRKGIPCLGIEPTAGTAQAARDKGIDTREAFFGVELAEALAGDGCTADLMIANNVLAHVPDINDFVAGFARLLKPQGVASFEFPHLLRLVADCQFDTIYHEHYSYLSLTAVCTIFQRCGLAVFDLEELPTHGGSLRVYAQRADAGGREPSPAVTELLARERAAGLASPALAEGFQQRADRIKDELLAFLIEQKRAGRTVAGYGAAAKGNTLLNYGGVRSDLLGFVADASPHKQGLYLPGSRIPVMNETTLGDAKPAFVLVLPWNLRDEIMRQLSYISAWGGQFVTAVPKLRLS
jgi:SAM-dependent methyltransferase